MPGGLPGGGGWAVLELTGALVEHGADVDAVTKENYTPLMIAVKQKHENAVTFLLEHGANLDLQDKDGNTALHHAIKCGFYTAVRKLLDFGASLQLYNKDRLTPLLLASNRSNRGDLFLVKELINRPECTKEQSIDAIELLGASIACKEFPNGSSHAFGYKIMMYGMRVRFQDHLNPLFKHVMEPVEAYQYRKESETVDELAQIEGDDEAICIEGLIIRERILGTESKALLEPIAEVASRYVRSRNFHACTVLHRRRMKIAQNCNESILYSLERLIDALRCKCRMTKNAIIPPAQKVVFEVLQVAILEYEKVREKLKMCTQELEELRLPRHGPLMGERNYLNSERFEHLFRCLYYFLSICIFSKPELCEEENTSYRSVLEKLYQVNPCEFDSGNTLLHVTCGGGCWFPIRARPCVNLKT